MKRKKSKTDNRFNQVERQTQEGLYGEKTKIDFKIDGSQELDILRELRNHFAHTTGRLLSNRKKAKKLSDRIVKHFNLTELDFNKTELPLPINKVIKKIFDGCKLYLDELYKQAST